jgi:hypothetical protein
MILTHGADQLQNYWFVWGESPSLSTQKSAEYWVPTIPKMSTIATGKWQANFPVKISGKRQASVFIKHWWFETASYVSNCYEIKVMFPYIFSFIHFIIHLLIKYIPSFLWCATWVTEGYNSGLSPDLYTVVFRNATFWTCSRMARSVTRF